MVKLTNKPRRAWPRRPTWWVVRDAHSVLYRGARACDALRHVRPGVTVVRNGTVIYPPPEELPLDN